MTDKQKRDLVFELYEEGVSYGQISKQTGIPKSTVHRIIKDDDTVLGRAERLGTFYGTNETSQDDSDDDDLGEIETPLFEPKEKKGLSGADLIALTETNGNQKLKLLEQQHRLVERSRESAYNRQMKLLQEQKLILQRKEKAAEEEAKKRVKAEILQRRAETTEEILEFFEEILELHEEDVELTDLQADYRQAKRLRAKFVRASMELGQKKETAIESKIISLLDEVVLHLTAVITQMQKDDDDETEFELSKRLLPKIEKFLDDNSDLLEDELDLDEGEEIDEEED